jgi:Ca2+-binding EF-hand superfamily protein
MFHRLKIFLALTTLPLLTTTAQAAPMDANKDGEISRIEYMSFRSNAFIQDDLNFDGKLTKQEIKEGRDKRNRENVIKRFKKLDANKDGQLIPSEMEDPKTNANESRADDVRKEMDAFFDKMDRDKNGNISRLEYNVFVEERMEGEVNAAIKRSERKFKRMDLDGDGVVTETEYVDRGRIPKPKKADPFEGLYTHDTTKPKKRMRRDGNGDGDITKREDREYNEYQFEKLDKNKNGVVTKDEARYLFPDGKNALYLSRH